MKIKENSYEKENVCIIGGGIGTWSCSVRGGTTDDGVTSSAKSDSAVSESSAGESGQQVVVGFTDMSSNEMSNAYKGLLENALSDLGAEMVYYSSNSSVDEQIKQLEDLVTRNVDVIFVKPVDNSGIEGGLVTVKESGIPVVFEEYDETLEDYVTCFDIAMNHYGYGQSQAENLIEQLEADPELTAHVGILWGMKGLLPAQQRRNGFVETIQPYIDEGRVIIEDEESIEGDTTKLPSIVEDWFTSHPEINTYVCPNDEMAVGVIACLDSANKSYDGIYIYGMDAAADALPYIQEGKMTASVSRNMEDEAKVVADLLVKVAKGEKVEKIVDFDITPIVVTSENVDEYIASQE